MHSFSFRFAASFDGLGGGGGGGGLAASFFWIFFAMAFGLGGSALLAGAFLAGAAFFLSSELSRTTAEGIFLRPATVPRSDSAEGGGAGMKRTFFFSFKEGDLAFVMVFFGFVGFVGFGNVVFKAKMGAGENGLASALAATFFAGALLAGFAFAAGLTIVLA